MASKVHVVPHFHWDREWYFTTEESKLLLINNMEEIFEMLENRDDYPCYVLDGQTAVLEDYFSLMPENKERFKKLVKAKKLIVGPWYTQTDEMVVGAESITRNLLYGYQDCEEFGDPMNIGYLPDSFGQSAQMPMILNNFGIKRAMFWRGVTEKKGSSNTEFYWKSDDGSQVLTQLLPLGYAIGKYLPQDLDALQKRCDKYMPVLDRGATGEHILLPNGHDQMPIQKDIFEVMKQLHKIYPEKEFFLSSFEKLFEELEKKTDYDTLQGEFLDGKYMRVHRSIFSSRADLKAMNTRIENKITNILEPLMSIAYTLGFSYYHHAVEEIYKEIMKNHAHDSIGMCCSDIVHDEIESRFVIAETRVDELIKFYKRKITDAISKDVVVDKLNFFNLLPYERVGICEGEITTRMKSFKIVDENGKNIDYAIVDSEIVDAGLIDRQIVHYGNYDPFVKYKVTFEAKIPAMGYQSFLIVETKATMKEPEVKEHDLLENKFFKIEVNSNGSLKIFDKVLQKTYDQVLIVEDQADDGDGYDWSPLLDDYILTSKDVIANVAIKEYRDYSEAIIDYQMEIPNDLQARKAKILDSKMNVKIKVKLVKGSRFIDLKFIIDNKSKDHRVRFYVPNNVIGKFSYSDNQFGIIERAAIDPNLAVWKKEGWGERPDAIYPMLSYVGIKGGNLAVITNSVREFELVGKDHGTIAITLFRTVGVLGKENLVRRPGRPSGIKMQTPKSQLQKVMEFDLSLVAEGSLAKLSRLAKEALTPIVFYNKLPYNAMKLNEVGFETPYSYSLLKETNDNTTLSVLKKAEKSDQLILRVFNTNDNEVEVQINKNINNFVNLNEEVIESDSKILKNQVKTLAFGGK